MVINEVVTPFLGVISLQLPIYFWPFVGVITRDLTYPTWGKGKSLTQNCWVLVYVSCREGIYLRFSTSSTAFHQP